MRIIGYIKREIVLSIAVVLAVVSMFLVPPDQAYLSYVDYRTIGILFCLMAVVEGFKELGVFHWMAHSMLKRVHSLWQMVLILMLLCFFMGMFITNDVALIAFVPFTLTTLTLLGEEKKNRLLIPVVILQTLAANMGSMLTPLGNPQNLYLYGRAQMGLLEFIILMLPFTAVAFLLLVICSLIVGGGKKETLTVTLQEERNLSGRKLQILYLVLFGICILTVARVVPYTVVTVIVLVSVLIADRKVLLHIDYALLLTFAALFVFIGNMGRIDTFRRLLEQVVDGHELVTAVIASQVISNVPAAILLSGFTENIPALIAGTNLGGLGTIIASMASLISFKYTARENRALCGKYLGYFTIVNVIFLAVLLPVARIVKLL